MKLLENRDDVIHMVNEFYAKVQKDELIGPIFNDQAKVDWSKHLPKMYDFWEDLLFHQDNYSGRPFPPHIPLGLEQRHFERWVHLFLATVEENFYGFKADEVKTRAQKIAFNFQVNLGLIKFDLN